MRYARHGSLVLAAWLAATAAHASSIGVYFAPDASDCDTEARPFARFAIYVIAQVTGDAGPAEMTGAEFRIEGVSPAWFTQVFVNPAANVFVGDPRTTGCSITFPSCQPGPSVLLCTIECIPVVEVPPTTLRVLQPVTPSSSGYQRPVVTACDPAFRKVCLAGGTAVVSNGNCTVQITETTWSKVKSLYGNEP